MDAANALLIFQEKVAVEITVSPQTGTVWVSDGEQILKIDRDGKTLLTVPLDGKLMGIRLRAFDLRARATCFAALGTRSALRGREIAMKDFFNGWP